MRHSETSAYSAIRLAEVGTKFRRKMFSSSLYAVYFYCYINSPFPPTYPFKWWWGIIYPPPPLYAPPWRGICEVNNAGGVSGYDIMQQISDFSLQYTLYTFLCVADRESVPTEGKSCLNLYLIWCGYNQGYIKKDHLATIIFVERRWGCVMTSTFLTLSCRDFFLTLIVQQ